MKLPLNKLIEPVDDLHGYVFYSVRNSKAQSITSFIDNYFLKKGFNVKSKVTPKSIDIDLYNNKKNSWDYVRSYIWLEDLRKDFRFSESYSNFCFGIRSASIRSHFGSRTPNYVEDYWNELEFLFNSGVLHNEILEVNFPFSLKKSPTLDTESLRKRNDDNIIIALDSGITIAQHNVILSVENIFLRKGFDVEAILNDDSISLILKNNKRGKWSSANFEILFDTEHKESTWHPLISYTYRKLNGINRSPVSDKTTKLYDDFLVFIFSDDTKNELEETIQLLDYPFRNKSFLSC